MVRDSFSSIFGDRRGLTDEQKSRQRAEGLSPFSRFTDIAYRRMALLDWWLSRDVNAASWMVTNVLPYSRLDQQVADALFVHDAEALVSMKLCIQLAGAPSEHRYRIVSFESWPTEQQQALEDWREKGRPLLLEPDGRVSYLGGPQSASL